MVWILPVIPHLVNTVLNRGFTWQNQGGVVVSRWLKLVAPDVTPDVHYLGLILSAFRQLSESGSSQP
jgi:hypothetical protein